MKNFRCYELAKRQYQACKQIKLQRHEQDQLQRAALSVCINLAEGSGKSSIKDRRRFYEIALCSHREVQGIIDILKLDQLKTNAHNLGGSLFQLVRALRAEAAKGKRLF